MTGTDENFSRFFFRFLSKKMKNELNYAAHDEFYGDGFRLDAAF